MTPKSKRKSIHSRMLRPVSRAFGKMSLRPIKSWFSSIEHWMLDWFDLYLASKWPQRWNSTWTRPWRTSLSTWRSLLLEPRPRHLRSCPKWSSDWSRSCHRRKRRNCSISPNCVHAGRRRRIRAKSPWVKTSVDGSLISLKRQKWWKFDMLQQKWLNMTRSHVNACEDIVDRQFWVWFFLTSCFSKSAVCHLKMASRMASWEGWMKVWMSFSPQKSLR